MATDASRLFDSGWGLPEPTEDLRDGTGTHRGNDAVLTQMGRADELRKDGQRPFDSTSPSNLNSTITPPSHYARDGFSALQRSRMQAEPPAEVSYPVSCHVSYHVSCHVSYPYHVSYHVSYHGTYHGTYHGAYHGAYHDTYHDM